MNMIPTFFGLPQSVVKGRFIHKMNGTALKLYTALFFSVQRQSSREVVLTTAQCQQLVGGSANSHAQARKQLVELGLVRCEPFGQDGFVYVVCDPDTRELWDDDHKRQGREIGKPSSENLSLPASKARARSRSKMDNAGVSFNYGHNAEDSPEPETALLQRRTESTFHATASPVGLVEIDGPPAIIKGGAFRFCGCKIANLLIIWSLKMHSSS